jgi:hypothetical protein
LTGPFPPAATDSPGGQDANAVYPLGSSAGESSRLQRQADELAADSAALLDRVGLRAGQSAIDLGCGPRSRTQMYPPGNTRRTVRLDLVRGMRPQIVQLGLADAKELDALDAALRPHLEDPRTVAMSGLLFLVRGRKPE